MSLQADFLALSPSKKLILVLLVITVLVGALKSNDAQSTPPAVQKEDPRSPYMLAVLGSHGKTMEVLRDPNSFELEYFGTIVTEKEVIGCLEFRARNGFGGLNKGFSVWRFTGDRNAFFNIIENKSVAGEAAKVIGKTSFTMDKPESWNKYCTQPSTDRTGFFRAFQTISKKR